MVAGANKNVYTNLRNVNNRLPTESNGFCVSKKYAAVPLSGSAGLIAILEVSLLLLFIGTNVINFTIKF